MVKDPLTKTSRILVEPHLIDADFRKAWMPFFCRSGHPVVTPDQFLPFVGHLLPQEPLLDPSRITGRDLQEVAKKSTAGGLDGWAWDEVKALSLPWFSGLALSPDNAFTTPLRSVSKHASNGADIPKYEPR